jgi:rubredoxin
MSYNKSKNALPARLCDWCGKPMPFSNQPDNLVCPRCHFLLLYAGISDDEIFGKISSSENGTRELREASLFD